MLPCIDNKYSYDTTKNTIYLITNNLTISKNFQTATVQNHQLNHFHKISKSISSNIFNKNKKKYRIINNNTIYKRKNNSALNENIYDYPQYKNNYSIISNISNEVTDLYSDFSFNKAPTLRQNISSIHHLIQTNKQKNFSYLKNLYHNSLFNNNYINETNTLIYDDKKSETINSSQICMNRNNSCGQLLSNSNRFFKGEENLTSKDFKKNDKIKESFANLSTSTYKTNRSNNNQILNTNLLSQTNRNIDPSFKKIIFEYNKNKEKNYFGLNTEKLFFNINDALYKNFDHIKNISEFENRILHMKIFQNFQYEKLNKLLYDKIYSLENLITRNTKAFEKLMDKYSKYKFIIQGYIKFLDEIVANREKELLILSNKKKKLEYDVDNLIYKTINRQKELEYLLEIRNFLYRVRYRNSDNIQLKNLHKDLNSKINIESKKIELAKFFRKLFGEYKNVAVYKYLCTVPLEKRKSVLLKKKSTTTFNNNNISDLIKKGDKIFSSPDEFISVLEFSEKKNLSLLKTLESRNLDIKRYKKKIEDLNPIDEQRYGKFIMEEIEKKTIELSKIKQVNDCLTAKFNYYSDENTKITDIFRKNKKKENFKSNRDYIGTDLQFYYTRKYKNLIAAEKYSGIVFLKKIVENFNNFISSNYNSFTVDKFYSLISPQSLEEIQEKVITGFDDKSQAYIKKYNFEMCKLFEFICESVIANNREYLKNEKNIKIIKKKNEEIQNEKKIKNTKIIMSLVEEKRIKNSKKLIEKWEKQTFYINKKIFSKPNIIKRRNYSQDSIKYKGKTNEENEKDNIDNYMNATEEN